MRDEDTEAQTRLRELWRAAWPVGVPAEPTYPLGEQPLSEYLRRWAAIHPDKLAIDFYGGETTYGELDRLSDRFAAVLADHGVQRGDRVSVMLSNCPQFHIVFFGILKRGAVYAPVSPMSTAAELTYQLQDCGASAIVAFDGLWPVVEEARRASHLRCIFTTSYCEALPPEPALPVPEMVRGIKLAITGAVDLLPALAACRTPPPAVEVKLDDVAALNYTGGTTGMPKGCIHTQRDMIYTAAANYQVAAGFDESTVVLNFFPEFWIAGENHGLIFPVFAGASLVLLARWDALAFMTAVQRSRVTNVGMPMDAVVDVLEHPECASFDLRSLKYARAVSFVKKLDVAYRRRWRELTGSTLTGTPYGMTETHTANTFTLGMQDDDFDLKATPVFVGLPVPGVDLKVCDFETGERLPLQAEGEIWMRTPALMKGYWGAARDLPSLRSDGWFRTGDLGVIDAQGYLHYLGRRKEMIKVNGMSVFPAELEAVLARHPSVSGCSVVAADDPKRGQRPVAFIVLRPGAPPDVDGQALEQWCRGVMASYKTPEVRLIDALPLTGTGKVRKDDLVRLLKAQ